jgi:hypothetical protein
LSCSGEAIRFSLLPKALGTIRESKLEGADHLVHERNGIVFGDDAKVQTAEAMLQVSVQPSPSPARRSTTDT